MQKLSNQLTIVTGFAIFTMLFGAGNFILPPKVGFLAGDKTLLAVCAFIITAVILPIIGLMVSFLFEGDYKAFFYRLGRIPGEALIAICMLILGPGLVLPRIINLCYEMLHPFIPSMSLLIFSLLFASLTFALTYRPTRLIDILGYAITPLKLTFVGTLIALGIIYGQPAQPSALTNSQLFLESLLYGYNTLDLLGTVFFGSVILDIFKKNMRGSSYNMKELISKGLVASTIGATVLALAYLGMSFLGTFNGQGLTSLNEAQALSAISLRVIGEKGGLLGALALLIACLATMIALSTVVSEYIQKTIAKNKINFPTSLFLMLATTVAISLSGLTALMKFSASLTMILYPVLITLTLCNGAYKLFNFKPVKMPVFIVFAITTFVTLGGYEFCKNCIYKQDQAIKETSF
ncbi:branched-chain amino acid transport system II carrier protein [Candidatus Dependentiae bacterium]|nr:branched-chain amino acid transport system II carrier protein [Candidatus Dependentiae bacterium]